jgi:two-component system chemotaxis sensor kinase CheA
VVTDITAELAGERAEEQRGEIMVLFERMLADRRGLVSFVEETTAMLEVLRRSDSNDAVLIKRIVHTLKGNAALFGLASIARTCHALEDRIEELHGLPSVDAYDGLASQWHLIVGEVQRLLGERAAQLELDSAQVEALEIAASEAPRVARLLARYKLEPSTLRLRHLAEQATHIAERLDKADITIHIEDNDVRLDRVRWAPFWTAFVHAVRNAIDHGIEPHDVREHANKPSAGSIWLRTLEYETGVVIEVEDDGAGIDWDVVRDRARKLELPSTTHADLEAALFTDGLSTEGGRDRAVWARHRDGSAARSNARARRLDRDRQHAWPRHDVPDRGASHASVGRRHRVSNKPRARFGGSDVLVRSTDLTRATSALEDQVQGREPVQARCARTEASKTDAPVGLLTSRS